MTSGVLPVCTWQMPGEGGRRGDALMRGRVTDWTGQACCSSSLRTCGIECGTDCTKNTDRALRQSSGRGVYIVEGVPNVDGPPTENATRQVSQDLAADARYQTQTLDAGRFRVQPLLPHVPRLKLELRLQTRRHIIRHLVSIGPPVGHQPDGCGCLTM